MNQEENSMKPEFLTNRKSAITTDDEENVRARAYELYEVHGRIDGPRGRRLAPGKKRSSRKQRTESRPSLNLKDHCGNRW